MFDSDLLVVGAGLSGLVAAHRVAQAGKVVRVLDKGRGLGGRMATRRIGSATFDHGAQFFTTREPRFERLAAAWRSAGFAREWFRGAGDAPDGNPRYRGEPGMTAPARHLARGLDVAVASRVMAVNAIDDGWQVELGSGARPVAAALLMTPPVPQCLELLEGVRSDLFPETWSALTEITYDRCIAVMAVLDGPSSMVPPGGFAPNEGPIAWIADNQLKGISEVPAVTIHASAEFSLDHWDDDRDRTARVLIEAASDWLGGNVVECQVHGWRYAKPRRTEASPCAVLSESPPLVLAGDAFGGPRVEGAAISGFAAADTLLSLLAS